LVNPTLRYTDLIGQTQPIARLKSFIDFFKIAGTTPGHILLTGEEGMGQTAIATAVANELGVEFQQVDAGSLEIVGDFTAVFLNLRQKQILMLSDLPRLRKIHLDRLREILRDGKMGIHIGSGRAQGWHVMEINPFTLVATCRRKPECPPELSNLFSLTLALHPYSIPELQLITQSIGARTGVSLEPAAAEIVARFSDGTPRNLETTLLRLSRAIGKSELSRADVLQAFEAFGIHPGLDGALNFTIKLEDISPIDFERMIVALLAKMGFNAETTKASGDGGIDVVALLERPIVGGRYLFQCKRFAPDNLVGSPTIREFSLRPPALPLKRWNLRTWQTSN
jgi:Holliday junction resolvasome RuvABC ATP-dependent DNA helicase subunit